MASSALLASSVVIHFCLPLSLGASSSFSSDSNPAVDREEPFPTVKLLLLWNIFLLTRFTSNSKWESTKSFGDSIESFSESVSSWSLSPDHTGHDRSVHLSKVDRVTECSIAIQSRCGCLNDSSWKAHLKCQFYLIRRHSQNRERLGVMATWRSLSIGRGGAYLLCLVDDRILFRSAADLLRLRRPRMYRTSEGTLKGRANLQFLV